MNGYGARKPFDDLRAALAEAPREAPSGEPEPAGAPQAVRVDLSRQQRTGIPEVVFAESKSPAATVEALARLANANGRALASRCDDETASLVQRELSAAFVVEWRREARGIVVARPDAPRPRTGGCIGVLTAGASDGPIAAEAALIAREMGVEVHEAFDAGVAGLHRLAGPLEAMIAAGADVLVVAAGMDGALPSVVSGLTNVPVIGLPTSVGYGFGGGGIGALTTMLQSCAPGLVVVNIDNGIGAGSTAALIANRVAAARSR